MNIFNILILIGITTVSSNALAKNLYISADGNDALPHSAVSIATPWKTLIHAIYNIKSGDTLHIRGGTYKPVYPLILKSTFDSQTKGGHPTEVVNSESGTLASPVTITGYKDEKVIIDLTDSRVFIRIENINYWNIQNINIINGTAAFILAVDSPADNIVLQNMYIKTNRGGDNAAAININSARATNTIIKNNYIVGPGTDASVHLNTSTIFVARTDSVTIANNRLENAPFGIYYKHANPLTTSSNIVIKNNYILNTSRASIETNSNGALFENNIFGKGCKNMRVNEANGVPGGDNNKILHNSFIDCSLTLSSETQAGDFSLPGAINNQIENNIFTRQISLHKFSSLPHNSSTDYNLYNPDISVAQDRVSYTLPEWQNVNGQDSHSLAGTPTFIINDTKLIPGLALNTNSIGKNAAADGSDFGADITIVGPDFPSFESPGQMNVSTPQQQ